MDQNADNFHDKKPKLSKLVLFCNALMQLPTSMVGAVSSGFLTVYYETVIGLNIRYIFLAMAIFSVYNAINDPIFGFLMEHMVPLPKQSLGPLISMGWLHHIRL